MNEPPEAEHRRERAQALMRSIIQRIATGPELSKDISRDEARAGMEAVLDGLVDPVQAGVFLIALRMKRESDEEMLGILDAIRAATRTVTAPVPELVDVADPYDGYVRTLPPSPFLPALLAACGVPAVSHGVERMGPKFGVTHRQVLQAAGLPVDLSPAAAAARLADPACGWAYVDQRACCPRLHALAPLRSLIVKRPALTTVETLAGPVRAAGRTHLLTGYVHKAYPRIYALLARHAAFDSALIVRGLEGGVVPSLRQTGRVFFYRAGGAEEERTLEAADFGFDRPLRPPAPEGGEGSGEAAAGSFDAEAAARAAAEAGRETLAGRPGPARDALICAAALCLWQLRRHDSLRAAADAVRYVLDSGRAAGRLA